MPLLSLGKERKLLAAIDEARGGPPAPGGRPNDNRGLLNN